MMIRLGCIPLCLGLAVYLAGSTARPQQSTKPANLGSVFRTAVSDISLTRDLGTGSHFCKLRLEVAWEPLYKPLFLRAGTIKVRFGPDKTGKEQLAEQKDGASIAIAGKTSAEIDVQVPAPDRSAAKIKELEGSFAVIVPRKMLHFSFDELKAAPTTKNQEGIEASLREFMPGEDHWTLRISLQYPKGGPTFESYQDWLLNNNAVLEKIGGKDRWKANGERTLKRTSRQAVTEYYFENSSGKNPSNWRLAYDTPGPIVEVTVLFRFNNLPLP